MRVPMGMTHYIQRPRRSELTLTNRPSSSISQYGTASAYLVLGTLRYVASRPC